MKVRLFILCFLGVSSTVSVAQITYLPLMEKQDAPFVWIKSIELTDTLTRISFFFKPPGEGWICLENNFHIEIPRTDKKIYMLAVKNIPICPHMQKVGSNKEYLEFEALFPVLESGIEKIDLIEKKRNGLNFFGVILNNGNKTIMTDTLSMHSEEEFRNFLNNKIPPCDSLEGLWSMTLTDTHLENNIIIDKHFNREQSNVAVVFKNKRYNVYKSDGTSLALTFRTAGGGRTIFFRKYFREIDQAVTGYVKNHSPGFIEMEIELPERLVHYRLLPDYRLGDRIRETLKFTRISPSATNK